MPAPKDPIKYQEWIKKITHIAWNKGKKTSEITKEKQKQVKLKNPTRYWLGKKRLSMTGSNNWNYKGGKITKICQKCGINFSVPVCRENAMFCSKDCCDKSDYKKELSYNINKGRKRTIDQNKKQSERQRKRFENPENHPRWKGGITPINNQIRGSLEYKLWEDSIFTKDGYCCKKCTEKRISKLVGHHILNFSKYPELRFAIDNGITFCKEHHKEFHHIYGIKNNTREQVIEFLQNRKEYSNIN